MKLYTFTSCVLTQAELARFGGLAGTQLIRQMPTRKSV